MSSKIFAENFSSIIFTTVYNYIKLRCKMNAKRKNICFFSVLLIIFSTSCATIIHGSRQNIKITSEPPDILVTIENGPTMKTPGEVTLKRDRDYLVEFNIPGEEKHRVTITRSLSGWIFGNIIFLPGWWIGVLVDAVNGAMWTLEPEIINVTFPSETVSKITGEKYVPPELTFPKYSGEPISVAVLNLQKGVGLSDELAEFIVDHIKNTLVQSGIFTVAEKTNVQKLLVANVSKLGDKFFINLQLTDTESDVIDSTSEESCYCKLDELPVAAETATKRLIINFLNKNKP